MQALIIRHAIAEEPEDFDGPDEQRPLTGEGRRKMREAAKGLASLVKRIDVLATSPLVRAVQTARIVADEFKRVDLIEIDELLPGITSTKLLQWVARQDAQTIALVGHEPGLSQVIACASANHRSGFVRMGKGAACMIEFEDEIAPGAGMIVWLMQSKHLRDLVA